MRDWVAVYLVLFGLWPLADPGHHADSLLSVADLLIHLIAAIVLLSRWKVSLARRN
jgi:hypothetical protein